MIDQGLQHGIQPGQPVGDHIGIIGQVTRVYPWLSEVTLITDKGHLVPVLNLRTGLRAVLAGTGDDGRLELRFIPLTADFQTGDQLVTSGIDGVYPPGLPVAEVVNVERNTAYLFANITCKPLAGVNARAQVLVLGPLPAMTERPQDATGGHAEEKEKEILMRRYRHHGRSCCFRSSPHSSRSPWLPLCSRTCCRGRGGCCGWSRTLSH